MIERVKDQIPRIQEPQLSQEVVCHKLVLMLWMLKTDLEALQKMVLILSVELLDQEVKSHPPTDQTKQDLKVTILRLMKMMSG